MAAPTQSVTDERRSLSYKAFIARCADVFEPERCVVHRRGEHDREARVMISTGPLVASRASYHTPNRGNGSRRYTARVPGRSASSRMRMSGGELGWVWRRGRRSKRSATTGGCESRTSVYSPHGSAPSRVCSETRLGQARVMRHTCKDCSRCARSAPAVRAAVKPSVSPVGHDVADVDGGRRRALDGIDHAGASRFGSTLVTDCRATMMTSRPGLRVAFRRAAAHRRFELQASDAARLSRWCSPQHRSVVHLRLQMHVGQVLAAHARGSPALCSSSTELEVAVTPRAAMSRFADEWPSSLAAFSSNRTGTTRSSALDVREATSSCGYRRAGECPGRAAAGRCRVIRNGHNRRDVAL